jgi:hypothetical protein
MAFVLVRLGISILLDSPDIEGTQVAGSKRGFVCESWGPFTFSPHPFSDIQPQYAPSAWITAWKVRASIYMSIQIDQFRT